MTMAPDDTLIRHGPCGEFRTSLVRNLRSAARASFRLVKDTLTRDGRVDLLPPRTSACSSCASVKDSSRRMSLSRGPSRRADEAHGLSGHDEGGGQCRVARMTRTGRDHKGIILATFGSVANNVANRTIGSRPRGWWAGRDGGRGRCLCGIDRARPSPTWACWRGARCRASQPGRDGQPGKPESVLFGTSIQVATRPQRGATLPRIVRHSRWLRGLLGSCSSVASRVPLTEAAK